ncbi:MAG: Cys-tRNA(Pro) deacylase [Paludibacter sp.]|nr:Cys-tRNA(Pro) deacylase [Bacteroidales bacterium]MCM1069925.1 Cys-tRNA(Pro) deacylase [Prevotella sp.]MCM1354658.1 Cys-tRNA(Pro) deacylase [Bacteroides sp.]MCM1443501.1 Cys-tRNA(Pro) deacylase [Muribaculum sp.]MCM1482607.1 Cys-tRNA(Pro) deacylase [Paludibacter sp.]
MATQKTNAIRLLDAAKISYELVSYKVDEQDLSAIHVAAQLGEDVACVFKTLVLRGDRNGIFVCIVPGDKEVDLKKAAKVSGNKSCAMTQMKELLSLTGYIRGGCSPIGMKRNYPMYIHESCLHHEKIYLSAGCRGMQVQIRTADIIAFAKLQVADLI